MPFCKHPQCLMRLHFTHFSHSTGAHVVSSRKSGSFIPFIIVRTVPINLTLQVAIYKIAIGTKAPPWSNDGKSFDEKNPQWRHISFETTKVRDEEKKSVLTQHFICALIILRVFRQACFHSFDSIDASFISCQNMTRKRPSVWRDGFIQQAFLFTSEFPRRRTTSFDPDIIIYPTATIA